MPSLASPSRDRRDQRDRPAPTVVDLIRRQVELTPTAPAVDDGRAHWDYQELAARVDAIAARLGEGGVGPGDLVGVCLPRSAEAVASILGVLRAGAGYVPLDPTHPVARRRELCERAALQVVIGRPEATRPLLSRARCLDPHAVPTGAAPAAGTGPDESMPAYVLFTSGSSGAPKGVRVLHRGVSSLIDWVRRTLADDLEVTAAGTSFGFDPSVIELFGPLVTGGLVRVLPNALALGDVDEGITFAAMAPSVASELLRARRLPPLRTLVVGGEVLPRPLAVELLSGGRVQRLINTYGPTEATVMVTAHTVEIPVDRSVPIGHEIEGAEVRLLDDERRPVGPGQVGEMWLGGAQVADGYLADPTGTRERFVALDDALGEPAPWYRTGDLACRRPDGTLDFRGRIDQQLKVRGFRIEPAEVEAALCALESVAQAVVVANGDGASARLIAYVVPRGAAPEGRELASRLHAVLPSYLVPTGFVMVDHLPLGSTGKVDRRALPPFDDTPHRSVPASRHATDAEEIVADLVRGILGRDGPVAADDDFLDDLGGTSLALVELLCLLEQTFDCRLALGQVVADTTIAGLAALAEQRTSDRGELLVMHPHGTRAPLFLVHAYLGSVLRYRRLGPHLPTDQPLIGIHARDLDGDPRTASIDRLADRTVELIRSAQAEGPYRLGGHSIGGLIAYEAARRLHAAGDVVSTVVLIDAPTRRSRAQYYWGELVVNWPDVRDHGIAGLRTRARSMAASRMSPHRRVGATNRVDLAMAQAGRANNLAVRAHRSRPYDGDVVVLGTRQGVQMALGNRTLGWDRLVAGDVRVEAVPGEHNTLFDPPHLDVLAAGLCQALDLDVPRMRR